jgi:hypothetical protein
MYYLSNFSNFPQLKQPPSKRQILKETGQNSIGTAGNLITIGYLGEQLSKGKLRKKIRRLYPKVAVAGALGSLGITLGKSLLKRKESKYS